LRNKHFVDNAFSFFCNQYGDIENRFLFCKEFENEHLAKLDYCVSIDYENSLEVLP